MTTTRLRGATVLAGALTTLLGLAGIASAQAATAATGTDVLGGPRPAASDSDATIVPDPSWTCGLPNGIVAPTQGEPVVRVRLQIGDTQAVGDTQYGTRRVFTASGGAVRGTRIQGSVLSGGQDYELTLSTGTVELEQRTVLRTDTGTLIVMRNCGVGLAGDSTVRVVGDFEAPTSSAFAWLNTGTFVGTRTVDTAAGYVEVALYDVTRVTPTGTPVRITDPTGVPNQTWDCVTGTGTRGAAVFSETVTMGTTLSVGASKRGTRTIMPVLGGPTTGRVVGKVLSGGADFQLGGNPLRMDARYTVATTDNEYILVHNCGPMGGLTPTFEARIAGPYRFLTSGKYLSEATASGPSTAKVTFYERR